jgi:general stress protein 26
MNTTSTQKRKQMINHIETFDTAMLTTMSPTRGFRSRPMHIADVEDDATLWFVTSTKKDKLPEILADPRVNVSMQSSGRYISVTGRCDAVTDPAIVQSKWTDTWNSWFPNGPETADVVLLRVRTDVGEFWDYSAGDRLRFVYEAGKALLNNDRIDAENIGTHETVALYQ